jgi:divalent metal cation (Fe/Co/Zn/Cd) transporter
VAILAVLRTAVRDIYRRLMDAVDPDLVDRAEAALLATPGVTGVRKVRMRWIGHALHAEADLDIDGRVSITEAHELAHDAEQRLTTEVPRLRTASIHAYPAHRHDPAAP